MEYSDGEIVIEVAKTQRDMRDVWRLTHDIYHEGGYADSQEDGMLRHYHHLDFLRETRVFVARDHTGQVIGTLSCTEDGPKGLPVDEDFPMELKHLRNICGQRNVKLGTCWRLVTRATCRNKLDIILKLMSAICEDLENRNITMSLHTINPKHVTFYQRMLDLDPVGNQISISKSAKNNPAVLMKGELSRILARWEKIKVRRSSARLTKQVV